MRTDCHTQDSLFQMKEEVNGVLKTEIIGSRRQRLFERRILAGNFEARNCLFAGN